LCVVLSVGDLDFLRELCFRFRESKMMRFFSSMIAIPISFQMIFYMILYLAQLIKDHSDLHVWILYEMELQIVWWDNEKLLLIYKDYSFCYVIIIIKQQYFVLFSSFSIKPHTKNIVTKHNKLFFFSTIISTAVLTKHFKNNNKPHKKHFF
jgi:hypothetical protein